MRPSEENLNTLLGIIEDLQMQLEIPDAESMYDTELLKEDVKFYQEKFEDACYKYQTNIQIKWGES